MNSITITGNLARDPELRYTQAGEASTLLGVAVNRRHRDADSGEWVEEVSYFDVICWRDQAEHAAASLEKGMRVVVTGRLVQRSWETKAAERRSKVEIMADEIGASLLFATASVQRSERVSAERPSTAEAE